MKERKPRSIDQERAMQRRSETKNNQLIREIQMVTLIQNKGLAKRLTELSVLLAQGEHNGLYVSEELQKLSEDLVKLAE